MSSRFAALRVAMKYLLILDYPRFANLQRDSFPSMTMYSWRTPQPRLDELQTAYHGAIGYVQQAAADEMFPTIS
jgi:hypothetical protein